MLLNNKNINSSTLFLESRKINQLTAINNEILKENARALVSAKIELLEKLQLHYEGKQTLSFPLNKVALKGNLK